MKNFLIALTIVFCLSKCTTDIDLTAPYEDITIVYGLIDQTRDVQFIKINKAFLGDEPLADMAAIRDSIEYDESDFESKRVEAWGVNGILDSWELQDTLVESINESLFYVEGITDPLRTVYYFEPGNFFQQNEDAEYRVVIEFSDKPDVEGFTYLIPNSPGAITKPVTNEGTQTSQSINFATNNSSIDGVYPPYSFKWNAEENAKRYELLLEFRYVENVWADECHTDLVSSEEKVLQWELGTEVTTSADGSEQLTKEIGGEEFYLLLKNTLEENPLITREVGVLDESVAVNHYSVFNFSLTVGDDDFNTYLDFNEPATGLAQERPQWTNINNGYGLFSSRLTQRSINIKISPNSLRELCNGQHTSGLNFCTKDAAYDDEFIFCGPC